MTLRSIWQILRSNRKPSQMWRSYYIYDGLGPEILYWPSQAWWAVSLIYL